MPTYDVIEASLNSPIDWQVFEKLVTEVLAQDDMPRLRRVGSYKDGGVDAYQSALFKDERDANVVVQITSQRGQSLKVSKTLDRLNEVGILPNAVVFVFKHPVASRVRADILSQCGTRGLRCDVRDQGYLVIQLGKNKTGLFARYFESVKNQFAALLSRPDPLATASDSLRHSMLLSVASYVVHPQARLVRQMLFHKTTLAALVAAAESTSPALVDAVKELLPEEQVTQERVDASLAELQRIGECDRVGDMWRPSDACIAQFGSAMGQAKDLYSHLVSFVIEQCKLLSGIDEAALGIIERNLRFALLKLLQAVGPLKTGGDASAFSASSSLPEVRVCISADLKDNIARGALIAFGAYVEDPENHASLSFFARAYSSLSLRNIDPTGRRWQQAVVQRSKVLLDTDAVLALIIKEIPEHSPIQKAIDALIEQGTEVLTTPEVVAEAAGTISRADRTYIKFAGKLDKLSPSMVDATVWHALVRGFYYARQNGCPYSWSTYWEGYYDKKTPTDYVQYLLTRSGNCMVRQMQDLPPEWLADLDTLSEFILKTKETIRYKAQFRDESEMCRRVRDDIHMLMSIALPEEGKAAPTSKGYLVSEDSAFFKAEAHESWGSRQRVSIHTRALPQLTEFVCGAPLTDDEVVRLMFNPAVIAAAESMADDIDTLTELGVNLGNTSLNRLEWDLRGGLHDSINRFVAQDDSSSRLEEGVQIVAQAKAVGLSADSFISELAANYQEKRRQVEELSSSVESTTDTLRKVVLALATTNKARRRANKVLKGIGLTLTDLGDEED